MATEPADRFDHGAYPFTSRRVPKADRLGHGAYPFTSRRRPRIELGCHPRLEVDVLTRSMGIRDRIVVALALLIGLGSIVLFAVFPLGSVSILRLGPSELELLGWDAFVSMVFFVQHSTMNRQWFRAWLAPHVDPRYHGAIYGITSGLALLFVVCTWQTAPTQLWSLHGVARGSAYALSAFALGLFVWGIAALRTFDPLGLRPIKLARQDQPQPPSEFVVRGPYRWVRHPLYSCIILAIWAWPDVTSDRLLFALLWTAWMAIGARLEEQDLQREFGVRYQEYRRFVPMLIPWRPWRGHS